MKGITKSILLLLINLSCHNDDGSQNIPGQWVQISNINQLILCLYQSSNNYIWVGTTNSLNYSIDGGTTWVLSLPVGVRVIHENTAHMLFAGSDSGLYKSSDGGLHWNLDTAGLPLSDFWTITSDSIGTWCGTGDGNIYYNNVGTWVSRANLCCLWVLKANSNGELFAGWSGVSRSTDSGLSWLPTNGYSYNTGAAIEILDNNTMLVSDFRYVIYRSTDAGQNWYNVTVVNNPHTVSSFAQTDSAIFAANYVYGVLISKDQGQSWFSYNDSLPLAERYFAITSLKDNSILVGAISGKIFKTKE